MTDWLIYEMLFQKMKMEKNCWSFEKTLNFNKQQNDNGIKILTPKQLFQRLPIALTQVKAGNTSENLLNEIRQIMYSL